MLCGRIGDQVAFGKGLGKSVEIIENHKKNTPEPTYNVGFG